jgi:transcriptional regulator with XRE-family HTH domain
MLNRDRLRRELAIRGMSQADLALAAGIHPVTITMWMTRGVQPTTTTLTKVAKALAAIPPVPLVDALKAAG